LETATFLIDVEGQIDGDAARVLLSGEVTGRLKSDIKQDDVEGMMGK
jgi:hypothetical protein